VLLLQGVLTPSMILAMLYRVDEYTQSHAATAVACREGTGRSRTAADVTFLRPYR
jgi:hypothetical protein